MTPRQRVLAALDHREPDRVPVDLSGHRSSGVSATLYPKLRECLGLPPTVPRVYDLIQQLAIVEEDVLDLLAIDTIELGRGFALEEQDWTDWTLPDGMTCRIPGWNPPERCGREWIYRSRQGRVIGRLPEQGLFFEQIHFPWAKPGHGTDLQEAFDEALWMTVQAPPGPIDDEELRAGAMAFRRRTERAILGLFGGNLLETGQMLYRNDGFLLLLTEDPPAAHRFLDRLTEHHLGHLERFLRLVGDCIDIIVFGDDLGMQSGPQISPRMYREFFKDRHRQLWTRAKELAPVRVMLHSCGGVRELIPDFIDAGLDALNPVQISCRGMDATELKAEFGRDLTFWGGGCDTQGVLPSARPPEVADHVRRQLETFAPGGGYVFQQVHNLLPDVPPANVVAMFQALGRG